MIPSHSTQVRILLSLKPFLQLCLSPLQSAVVQEFAQESDGHGAGAQIEAAVLVVVAGALVDVEFVVELLQAVLHAAQRQTPTFGDGPIGEAERDIDEDLVFGIGKAVRLAEALLLQAPHLAVDDALALDEDRP